MFSFIADKLNVKNLGEILAPSYTPEQELHSAIEEGLEDKFIQLLDEQNLSPHTPNAGGNQPIHTAAYYGRVRILENLLSRGIDVNAPGPRENTPLHFASSQSHFEAVKFLISNGANPAVRNRNGKTSYDVAKGDSIRQYLLPLQFRHEDPNVAATMLPPGITPSVDPMAPRPVIAPPPMGGMPYDPSAQAPPQAAFNPLYAAPTHSAIPRGPAARINRGEYRPIQADGFGTSVGNEQLTAKYGNTREVKVTAPPPAYAAGPPGSNGAPSAAVAGPPLTAPDGGNPFSAAARGGAPPPQAGGYPGYGAAPGSAGRGPPPQFKIFNPKIVSNNAVPVGGEAAAPPAPAAYGGYQQPAAPQYAPRGPFGAPPQQHGGLDSVPLDSEEVTLSASASVLQ